MGHQRQWSIALFGTFLASIVRLNECGKLDGYKFPVYSTQACPLNQTEWSERSSALNCSKRNGYMCLPNQNFTELLEFCYTERLIRIQEGVCLYLVKHVSKVNAYNCSRFRYGCNTAFYLSNRIFEHPACTSIGEGCFLAEPSCERSSSTLSPITTKKIHSGRIPSNDRDYSVFLAAILLGLIILICIFIVLSIHYQRKWPVCKRNNDAECPKVKEHQPLLAKNSDKPTQKEPPTYQNEIFDLWQNENNMFIPTKASEEVEKVTESTNLVIVTGYSGSGKSAIIQHIALKYRERGWNVKPVNEVNEIVNEETFERKLFVFDDPIGKESLDEISYSSWVKNEKKLKARLKTVTILISTRKCVLCDPRVKGLLKIDSNIVDIDDEIFKLTDDEKRKILKIYAPDINLSEEEWTEIFKIKTYFPLLCNLYSSNTKYQKDGLRFFKEPVDVFKEEIHSYRNARNKEKYCALVLLIFFNNNLCVNDILEHEFSSNKFKHSLELCGMNSNTAPFTIGDHLKSLEGFFVKRIGDTYMFYHDFVMEVTTFVFGTDYPVDLVNYADIGFLRRKVKLETCFVQNDPLTIYLSNNYILNLGNRLFSDIFGDRLLDVVLNPCLRNKKVIEVFTKEIDDHPEKLKMLAERKKLKIEQQQAYKNLLLSKLAFVSLENEISPLFALIVFFHTDLSLYCLKQMDSELLDSSLFSAVCCNGSIDLFNLFSKEHVEKFLTYRWKLFYPLHIVSVFHNYEMLCELIRLKVDVNLQTDEDKSSSLILAAGNDTTENEEYQQGYLSEFRRNKTIEVLLSEKGVKINLCRKDGASPLYVACQRGYNTTVQLLLQKGANINLCMKYGAGPLFSASENGHYNTVQILLSKGADINLCSSDGAPPLYVASLNGYYDIVTLLLNSGANINLCMEDGDSPLYAACLNGHHRIVQLLVDKGADINLCKRYSENPLFIASRKGHDSIVEILVNNGANINYLNEFEVTPLNLACQNGRTSTVQVLLNRGAAINLCKRNGESPLYVACKNGHDSTLQCLLKNGADINLPTKNGESPLYAACANGHRSTVQLILNNGGIINNCSKDGESPLYAASKNGYDSIVKLLLKGGADKKLCTKDGLSPLNAARSNGHISTEQLLLNNGICM